MIACQIGLALRDEIADLEVGGARAVQVDEPALREGLPLKRERWESYLDLGHRCLPPGDGQGRARDAGSHAYVLLRVRDILAAIDRLDADVISIENARSDDAMLRALASTGTRARSAPASMTSTVRWCPLRRLSRQGARVLCSISFRSRFG